MKLLLDQNLSRYLLDDLLPIYPNSSHVALLELNRATDKQIWDFARSNGYIIASKDSDFLQLALIHGAPPKIIIITLGNASTEDIKNCFNKHAHDIELFANHPEEAVLILP